MKILIVITSYILFASCSVTNSNKNTAENTNNPQTNLGRRHELIGKHENAGEAHLSANVFAKEVGDLLKSEYPSKIANPRVAIGTRTVGGKKMFTFKWTCDIIPTTPEEAHYHFDRRGTVASGETMQAAMDSVKNEM